MSTAEDRRYEARDEARRLIHGDDIDADGQPITSPLTTLDAAGVADRIAAALTRDLMQQHDAIEITAETDGAALNVTAWAKDSTGETDCRDYVIEVKEA